MIANPHNMYLPGLESVSYPPKKINTVAVKVTPENIGILSIEFEAELLYSQQTGQPYFFADFDRGSDVDSATVTVRLGDWIVVLWDQFRIFRENEFLNTFRMNYAGLLEEPSVDHDSPENPPRNYATDISLLPETSSK